MQWWKRLILSVISVVFGYGSLDYLYYAFSKLTDVSGNAAAYTPKGDGLGQLLGGVMFILWFVVIGIYIWFIRKSSLQIDIIEEDSKTGEQKVRRKWFDIILQIAFILTGMAIRWAYLIYVYLPGIK